MLIRLAILLLTICSYSHSSPYSWTQISGTEQTPVQYIEDNPEVEIIWGYENGLWFQYSVVGMNESIENSHPTLEFLSPDKNYWIRTLGDTPAATQNKPDSVIIPKLNWNPESYFKGEWEVRKIHYGGWNLGANRILIESLKAIQSTSPGELNEKFSEKVLIQEIAPISNKVLQLEQQTYSHEKYLRAYEDNNTSRVETAYFRLKEDYETYINDPMNQILSDEDKFHVTSSVKRFYQLVERSKKHLILRGLQTNELIYMLRKN